MAALRTPSCLFQQWQLYVLPSACFNSGSSRQRERGRERRREKESGRETGGEREGEKMERKRERGGEGEREEGERGCGKLSFKMSPCGNKVNCLNSLSLNPFSAWLLNIHMKRKHSGVRVNSERD